MLANITLAGVIFFVIDWAIKLALLVYIPRGRKPSAALAWLLAIFALPVVLSLTLFLLIGNPKLSRRRRRRQRTVDQHIDAAVGELPTDVFRHMQEDDRDRYLPLAIQNRNLTQLPPTTGNSVTVLVDYNGTINDMAAKIDEAEHYVFIEYFIIALDPVTQPLFDAMERAVKRGVEIHLLFDWLATRSYPGFKTMKAELTRIGVKWQPMLVVRPFTKEYNRPDLRNHRKIMVIDSRLAYIGSLNLIQRDYHAKKGIQYEELTIRMTGPIVMHCAAIFAGDWYGETGHKLDIMRPGPEAAPEHAVTAQLLPSGSGYDSANNLKLFVALLYAAKKRVVITNPYFVPNDALLTAATSAVQRGVEVIVINSAAMEQWMVGHAQRSYYQQLLEAGVQIYLRNEPIMLHSKHMTIDDDIAVIGSSNMDIRSFELNMECVVVAYDRHVVSLLKEMHKINLAECVRVDLATWKKRPLKDDFLDSVARLTAELQ